MLFRSEIFQLCKKLKKMPLSIELGELLFKIHVVSHDSDKSPVFDGFGLIATQINAQFLGYLIVNEHHLDFTESASNHQIPVCPRSQDEIIKLLNANRIIEYFISECTRRISTITPAIAEALSPYSHYIPLKTEPETPIQEFTSTDLFEPAIEAFISTHAVQLLYNKNYYDLLNKLSKSDAVSFFESAKRELYSSRISEVPSLFESSCFEQNINSCTPAQLLTHSLLIAFSIRESLSIACQLLFRALSNGTLIVLDEDNIIQVQEHVENKVTGYIKLLIYGSIFDNFTHIVGDASIIKYTIEKENKFFGRIEEETSSFDVTEGETTSLVIRLFDESLNPFYNAIRGK